MSYIVHHQLSIFLSYMYLLQQPQQASIKFVIEIQKLKYFHELFDKDICNLMNACYHHTCNPSCYKWYVDASKNICKYNFLQTLINKSHFDINTRLLHI